MDQRRHGSRPRRFGVLTYHRCINYGSYWQARCLIDGLRGLGADAVLLDHHSPAIDRIEWRCALRPTLPATNSPGDLAAYAAKARSFLQAVEHLPRSQLFALDQPEQAGRYDAVVVGSDEVWNLRHPWYGGHSIFYGAGLSTDRLVSYAASFGNQDEADGLDGFWARLLRNFAAISVRDDNSRRIVRSALCRDSELVLDPCLQFPPKGCAGEQAEQPYIALYGHSFPAWLMAEVRRVARREGRRIVSIGYRNNGADEHRLEAGPSVFAHLIAQSAAVVTNFFHGCVFALLHRRPLATAPSAYRLNKVRDLLCALRASPHMVTPGTPPATFTRLLREPPHPRVFERIDTLRRSSADYLRTALELPT